MCMFLILIHSFLYLLETFKLWIITRSRIRHFYTPCTVCKVFSSLSHSLDLLSNKKKQIFIFALKSTMSEHVEWCVFFLHFKKCFCTFFLQFRAWHLTRSLTHSHSHWSLMNKACRHYILCVFSSLYAKFIIVIRHTSHYSLVWDTFHA